MTDRSPIVRRCGLLALLLAVLCGPLLGGPVPAADAKSLMGKFLVAGRELQDPNFRESVVLLVRHTERGAVGVIVNRPTPMPLSTLAPELDGANRAGTVNMGGPVEPDTVQLLVRSSGNLRGADPVLDDVQFSRSAELLGRLLSTEPAGRYRIFMGYAGWGSGQLESEIDRGDWHVVPATAREVFDENPGRLWRWLLPADPALTTDAKPARSGVRS